MLRSLLRGGWYMVALALWLLLGGAAWTDTRAAVKPSRWGSLEQWEPEDKVAQLFLVAWQGEALEEDSPAGQVLRAWPVGGVVLQPSPEWPQFPKDQVVTWVHALQALALEHQQPRRQGFPAPEASREFVPLFIAVRHEGNGPPHDALQLPYPLPSMMALGATWNPDLAYQVGLLLGREMRAWGINLVLGPLIDVLDPTFAGQPGDLGVRLFGEHPYWVTRMAQAYIQGLHQGGEGRLAVVAAPFPGYGGAARSVEEEIPTVPKPREQLENASLAPFLRVADSPPGQQPDGFLVAHVRYQAFQGTIRGDTPPLSLDPQALTALWRTYPELQRWYEQGDRVFISMDLGSPALKRYYQAQEQAYNPTQVALNAFLAGNDMLYVGPGFVAPGSDYWSTLDTVLTDFARKYREDPVFAQRVDASVERILALKNRLYPQGSLTQTLPPLTDTPAVERREALDVLLQVAQQSATLLVPTQEELTATLPLIDERLVILVDEATLPPCPTCEPVATFPATGLRESLLRLYGPEGSGQLQPGRVRVFTAREVAAWLQEPENPAYNVLRQNLEAAPWVVVLIARSQGEEAQALLQLLEQYPELWREKQIEVFSFDVPYVLQPSHLANVSVYYGLYSKGEPFLDIAARLLLRELQPQGASPVSVPALGYSIATALTPRPDQEIPLVWVEPGNQTSTEPQRQVVLNQTLTVQVGPVVDANGHPVPDGTPVEVLLTGLGGEPVVQRVEIFTREGLGRASFTFDREGIFEIRARSGPAEASRVLVVEVIPPPTPAPTATPTPPAPAPTPTPAITPAPRAAPPPPRETAWVLWLSLVGWMLSAGLVTAMVHWYRYRQLGWALRLGAVTFVAGVWSYNLSRLWQRSLSPVGSLALALVTALLVGIGLYAWWRWKSTRSTR